MQIEITQPSETLIRLTVLETDRGEAPQFRLALMSTLNLLEPDATSVDILALNWYHTCQYIERHFQEEYDLEKRVCESMAEKGYPDQVMWREPLRWVYAGRTYKSVTALQELILVAPVQTFDLGTFAVSGDSIRVTDPCYDVSTWCAGEIQNVQPGTWLAQSVLGQEGGWGARVRQLRIRHRDAPADIFETDSFSRTEIDVGVDSGQAGFFDAARYPTDPCELEYKPGRFYGDCCKVTSDHSRPGGGIIPAGFGVVTSSGYGDGGYSCYVTRNAEGRVIAAFVTFIGDEEEEDEETD